VTYAPATLQTLAKLWTSQGGVNLGVVGDTAHQAKGTSYHLGRDALAVNAYSRQTARDRVGLTNAASAIDLGRLDGTLMNLRKFSVWLVEAARANKPGTSDIREIIYSPDGKSVLRWDRERGYASPPWLGEADSSHLTHTHISWYRDAERSDHTTAFRAFFAPLPDTSTGDNMRNFTILTNAAGRIVPASLTFPDASASVLILATGDLVKVNATWAKQGIRVRLKDPIVAGKPRTDDWMLGWLIGDDAAFALARNVIATPYTDAAFNAGVAAAAKAAAGAKRAG